MSATAATGAEAAAAAEPKRRLAFRRLLNHLGIFAALLAAWEFVTATGIADPLLFPRPSDIVVSLVRVFITQGNIWWHLWVTMAEAIVGFFVGSMFGMGLAVAAGLSETMRRYLKPYVIIMEATPRIALGPLMIAWLGFGWESKIAIITLVCFFAPFVNTLTGMLTTDDDAQEMFRSLGASKWQAFWKLQLPSSMPIIMAGLRLAMASALAGALVAEFISANEGIGVLLNRYTFALNMASSFACLLTLTALGFLLYRIMEIVDERVVFWEHDDRMAAVGRKRAAEWSAA